MNLLVCGGRDFNDEKGLYLVLDAWHKVSPVSLLIHGAARGADRLAAKWANDRRVVALPFPADWEAHGKSAGPRRNEKMLREGKPDMVIAFPGGRGTAHMVRIAREAGVKVMTVTGSSDGPKKLEAIIPNEN